MQKYYGRVNYKSIGGKMKYVIDLDELTKWQIENDTLPIVPFVKSFLKSKSPVEEIAEGKVVVYKNNTIINDSDLQDVAESINEYQCKNIKIYIEVIK